MLSALNGVPLDSPDTSISDETSNSPAVTEVGDGDFIPVATGDGLRKILWSDVKSQVENHSYTALTDKPITISVVQASDIEANKASKHDHSNLITLEKFGEDSDGDPTYNGNVIDTTIAARDVYDALDSNDNTISLSAKQGRVLKEEQDSQQIEIDLNTAKVTNVNHDTVPDGALFTDTVYDDTDIRADVSDKMNKILSVDNTVPRFDGVSGQVQGSGVNILDNGNVGIGITNPEYYLDVSTANDNVARFASTSTQYSIMRFEAAGYVNQNFFISYGSNHVDAGKFAIKANSVDATAGIGLFTSGVERLLIRPSGNVEHSSYTKLGSDAPAIKHKKLTGETASSEGGRTTVAHGLDGDKIIAFNLTIRNGPTGFKDEFTGIDGYQASVLHDADNFIVDNHATNSQNILNKPFIVLITYSE